MLRSFVTQNSVFRCLRRYNSNSTCSESEDLSINSTNTNNQRGKVHNPRKFNNNPKPWKQRRIKPKLLSLQRQYSIIKKQHQQGSATLRELATLPKFSHNTTFNNHYLEYVFINFINSKNEKKTDLIN